ncbi:MAG: DUF5916 domain-containing protein [Myxococcota bacterium]
MLLVLSAIATAGAAPAPASVAPAHDIVVDGVLDEADWAGAQPVTVFQRFLPTEGDAPPGVTEIRFLQDDRHLYVGIRVRDAGYPIRARVSPREDINSDDQVGIYLDTFHDGRSGYIFYLNPLGIQQDIRHSSGAWIVDWNTAFRSEGHVLPGGEGYEIEVAFPWRSLKFPARKPGEPAQTWGLVLTRKIPSEGAKYSWPLLHRNRPILFAEEGLLEGVDPPRVGSGIELVPSLTMSQRWAPDPVTGAPPDLGHLSLEPLGEHVRPSLDARFGITPDLGIAATVNPDFSQVEADTADVRLNPQFAYQFPELRPFFLDGADAFTDPADTLYTRSIADPLAGAKLTGRAGPLSIGVLSALDRSPLPSITEGGTPGFGPAALDGRWAEDLVGRLRLDAFGGGLVGVSFADKRIVPGPDRAGGGGVNDVLGGDVLVPIGERWVVSGAAQGSRTADGQGRATFGESAGGSVIRSSGIGTGFGLDLSQTSSGFRRETGFLTQAGVAEAESWLDHTFTPSGAVSTVAPGVWGYARTEATGDRFGIAGVYQDLVVDGIHTVPPEASASRRREQGAEVDGWGLAAGYTGQVGAVLELSADAEADRLLDFGTLGPAHALQGSATAAIRATRATRLDLTLAGGRHQPVGGDVETARLVRARLNWQFTRELGARLVVQDNRVVEAEGVERGLLGSLLLTWLEVPGTAAYLGWTEILALDPLATTERIAFLKVSVLLRP